MNQTTRNAKDFDFVRIMCVSPRVSVANPKANVDEICKHLTIAESQSADIVLFPELSITGYTCGDLFHQPALINAAKDELLRLIDWTRDHCESMVVVGVPINVYDQLYNCAAVIARGELLGLVPKSYLPNYKEFYERRWFHPASSLSSLGVQIGPNSVCLQQNILFEGSPEEKQQKWAARGGAGSNSFRVGVEICEDLWTATPPSAALSVGGAEIILNLSASNETVAKADYRRQLVQNQSGRCLSVYAYAGSGPTESTTDLVFGGHCLIAVNGELVAESKRFERNGTSILADVDLDRIRSDRQRQATFWESSGEPKSIFIPSPYHRSAKPIVTPVSPSIVPLPFVPGNPKLLDERCEEIFQIQIAGLVKRLEMVKPKPIAIGISGGLDSTLSLLVLCRAVDALDWSRDRIVGITMPGFGTTKQTLTNATGLMKQLGVTSELIDIRQVSLDTFRAIGHHPFGINPDLDLPAFTQALAEVPKERRQDLVFENVQARMRTLLLMSRGFVVGTGDLSELALGWATYNGDHMSMYNPNVSVPKTLVRFLVRHAAQDFDPRTAEILHSIVATPISPELLPTGNDQTIQRTEDTIGPYEVLDFFLFHVLRHGASPSKVLFLAEQTSFTEPASTEQLKTWLRGFYRRFFANQFKRSCLPDGPKVGSVTLSPRGDWRMPSDADASAWIAEVDAW